MFVRRKVASLLVPFSLLLLAACSGVDKSAAISPIPPSPTAEEEYYFNQILDLDAIRPVYDPQFIPADQAAFDEEQLVLGVAIDGQAKAYPIAVLNPREIVNDELAGIPILATW